ncbi:MAG TPA: nuclear transport factor 2 family protein [Pyrinomonadaceae bacterium]|nr:nuclear transport factor 2 family protein [Pyrinomonadaceae bacterium]
MKVISAILLSLVAFAGLAEVRAQTSDSEHDAIKIAVETYLYEEDRAKVARVVDSGAKILGVDADGKLVTTATSKPAGKMPKGATTRAPRQKIVNIDIFANGAVVKVETDRLSLDGPHAELRHAQYLSLLKLNGEWKIVSILMPSVGR